MKGSYLGPNFDNKTIRKTLNNLGAVFKQFVNKDMIKFVASKISKGQAIGWFQGRMEFGPRALGARSILADPRNNKIQSELNLKIKFRESFRPFAPSVLEHHCKNWFNLNQSSPYMLVVSEVNTNKLIKQKSKQKSLSSINNKRSVIPGVTHIDNTARVQTVNKNTNKKFYELIEEFYNLTKTPILINTSFNIRGEPIVCTPKDAFKCFMGTDLDLLIIENFVLEKEKQKSSLIKDYKKEFSLD